MHDCGENKLHLSRRGLLSAAIALAGTPFLLSGERAAAEGMSWKLLGDGDGPVGRWDHTVSYDETSKQLLIFGGRDVNYAALGDTWLFDLSELSWKQVESSGPEPRFGQAVAVDQKSGKLILFGGQIGDTFFNDTWVFDFASEVWSQLDTGSGALPTPRYGLAAVVDGDGKFLISHGFTFEGRFDDTWSLDFSTNEWSDVSPVDGGVRPLKRCLHEMVWDRDRGQMLLYGGCSSGFGPCPQGDFWAFDPATQVWTELTPAEGPAARSNPALVYDRNAERALLIGGLTDAGYVSDIWSGAFDGDAFGWEAISAEGEAPAPRASHDLVLARGDLYLFGGTGVAGVTADLWKLSLD